MSRLIVLFAAVGLALFAAPAPGQDAGTTRWIESWGTSQRVGPMTRRPPAPSTAKPAPPPPASPSPIVPHPDTLSDQTVRMIVRVSAGGPTIRLELSNASAGPAVTFDAVHAGLAGKDSAIATGSDRTVTFGGKAGLTLFAGAKAVSDPIHLDVPALTEVAVSVYVREATPVNTVHPLGLNPTYIAPGNVTAATRFDRPIVARSYFWLSGLSVPATSARAGTIVAFGDSITDGYATTPGTHRAWPELLAERLQANPPTAGWGVVNAGISGNRMLKSGAGDAGVARFDEDVLSQPGVKWVLILEGINDINMTILPAVPNSQDVSAEQIIAGLGQMVDRAHQRGIKVAGATIMPTKGLPFYSEQGEAMRRSVNDWMRGSGRFDAVIDFDAATRDAADPLRLRPEFDSGDHVHPNDAGNRAMAQAIDLTVFR